jgi:DNA-binding transcriptional LysR family regulator
MEPNKLINLLPELAIFVSVIEEGNFATCADKLGVAPSSVSRSMSKLETKLECRLLERTTRKMSLTPIGEEVYLLASDMFSSAKQAVQAVHSLDDGCNGKLRVAVPKALANQVLKPLFIQFIHEHPQVSLQLKVVDHFIDPVSDEVDLVIHIAQQPIESLVAKELGTCPLVLCASPKYLNAHALISHPSELERHKCITLGENVTDNLWRFVSGTETVTVPVSGPMMVNHSEIRRDAVMSGLGISLFPTFVVREHIQSGALTPILQEWQLQSRYQGKVYAQYAQSKYVATNIKIFVSYLAKHCSNLFNEQ